jgi:hypothetical protein
VAVCGGKEGRPPVRRAPVDQGPCRPRGESGSISTSPGIRGGNTDLGLPIATPPGRRRKSGYDFARATALIRPTSCTMQSFDSRETRHSCCTWRTMQVHTRSTFGGAGGALRVGASLPAQAKVLLHSSSTEVPRKGRALPCLFPNRACCKEAPGRGRV